MVKHVTLITRHIQNERFFFFFFSVRFFLFLGVSPREKLLFVRRLRVAGFAAISRV